MLPYQRVVRKVKAQEIHMRDAFVYTDEEKGLYYLFGTTDVSDGAANVDPCFEYYQSEDLINFEGPYLAFYPEKGFWGVKHFWAPEVHPYGDSYYLFASCKGGIGEDRGTCVLKASRPNGPYAEHSKGHVTLKNHECLDGTLYVEDGQPYIVFCHEWTEIYYGRVCALPLSRDLREPLSQEPLILVDTQRDYLPWIRQMKDPRVDKVGYLTDAPWLHRAKDGTLHMLWSSYSVKQAGGKGQGGYTVAVLTSESGSIRGPWRHRSALLLDADIGHVSMFRRLDGQLMLVGHLDDSRHGSESPVFLPLDDPSDIQLMKSEVTV